MTKRAQTLLFVGGIFILITLGVIAYAAFNIIGFITGGFEKSIPKKLVKTGVLVGPDRLSKKQFFKLEKAGFIRSILESRGSGSEKERKRKAGAFIAESIYSFDDIKVFDQGIVAASHFGIFEFDHNGKLRARKFFEPQEKKVKIGSFETSDFDTNLQNLRIFELSPGKTGFIAHSSTDGVTVYDENGDIIWSFASDDTDLGNLMETEEEADADYEKSKHVLETAAGDLDGDGIAEFLVARKGIGLQAFDQRGKELWKLAEDFPSSKLEIRDLDSDGKTEVIQIGKRIIDGAGAVLREFQGFGSIVFDESGKGLQSFLTCDIYEFRLKCTDEAQVSVIEGEAPLSRVKLDKSEKYGDGEHSFISDDTGIANEKVSWVRFQKGGPKYLAVVGAFIGIPRANLYLYDLKGNLIYHELLDEDAEAMTVIRDKNGDESLLVAGSTNIWRYGPGPGLAKE